MHRHELDRPPVGGRQNDNHFISYENFAVALRRPGHGNRIITDRPSQEYFRATGFTTTDQGSVTLRSSSDQYDFMRKAAESGLAVLPPLALEGDNLILPFLDQAQTIAEYLEAGQGDERSILPAIFADLRNAHRLGFIYGDRCGGNILVDEHSFVHIDFDFAVSGKTAREFEVADMATHLRYHGGEAVLPVIATTLGTMCAQTPGWIDLDKTAAYMHRMGEVFNETQWFDTSAFQSQEAMIASTYAIRDSVRGGHY